jgi:hypothetical protein
MRITLTEEDVYTLAHIMHHFTDYMALDDRVDHGFGILKGYRKLPDHKKRNVFLLAGKLMRLRRKIQNKKTNA